MKVRIGMIQSFVRYGEREKNLDAAYTLLKQACGQGAQVAVLPE